MNQRSDFLPYSLVRMADHIERLLVGVLVITVCTSQARPACQVITKQARCTRSLVRLISRNDGIYWLPQFEFEAADKPSPLNEPGRRISLKAVTKKSGEYTANYLDKCLDPEKDDIAIPLELFNTDVEKIPSIKVYLCTGRSDCKRKKCQNESECCDLQCSYNINTTNCPTLDSVTTKNPAESKTENTPTVGVQTRIHQPVTKITTTLSPGEVVAICIAAIAVLGIVAIFLDVLHQRRKDAIEPVAPTIITVRLCPVPNVQSPENFAMRLRHVAANQTLADTRLRVEVMATGDNYNDHSDVGEDTQRLTGITSLFLKVFFNVCRDNEIYIILCPRGTDLFRDDRIHNLLRLSGAFLSPRQHNGELGNSQVLCSLLDYRFGFRRRTIVVEENYSGEPNQNAPDGHKYLGELSLHSVMQCGSERSIQEIVDLITSITNPPAEEPTENEELPIVFGNLRPAGDVNRDRGRNEGDDAAALLAAPRNSGMHTRFRSVRKNLLSYHSRFS